VSPSTPPENSSSQVTTATESRSQERTGDRSKRSKEEGYRNGLSSVGFGSTSTPSQNSSSQVHITIEKTTTSPLSPDIEMKKALSPDSGSTNNRVSVSEDLIEDGSKRKQTNKLGLNKKDKSSNLTRKRDLKRKKQIFREIFYNQPKNRKVNDPVSPTKMNWKLCKGNMCSLNGGTIICCCDESSHISAAIEPYVPASIDEDDDEPVNRCTAKIYRNIRDLVSVLDCQWKLGLIRERRKNVMLLRENLRLRTLLNI